MFLNNIFTHTQMPEAFAGRDDIEYVALEFHSMEFHSWGSTKIAINLQCRKGYRDLSGLLYYLFSSDMYFPIDTSSNFGVSITDEVLNSTDWELNGGVERRLNDSDTFQTWRISQYKELLRGTHETAVSQEAP